MNYKKLMAKTFSQKSDNNTLLALGLMTGLAAGAVIAMLFAPKSGKDLRKRISDKVMGFGQDGKHIYALLISKINGKRNRSPKSVENVESVESGENLENIERDAHIKGQGNHHGSHTVVRKPKSDIKELVQGAHGAAHTEQGL